MAAMSTNMKASRAAWNSGATGHCQVMGWARDLMCELVVAVTRSQEMG